MSTKKSQTVKDIIGRLKSALNLKTDTSLAKLLNVKQNTIASWKIRNSIDYHLMFTVCDNINLNWLLTGEEEKPVQPQNNLTRIPILARADAAILRNNTPRIASLDYLRLPGVPPESCAVIVHGDSMAPLIKEGDYAIFLWYEEGEQPQNGDIVVIDTEWNEIMLKRYYKNTEGKEYLISDNPEYKLKDGSHIALEMLESYTIKGKVIEVINRRTIK